MFKRSHGMLLLLLLAASLVVLQTSPSYSQSLTIPDDCDNNLTSQQIATLVTMFAAAPDGATSYITCVTMMSDSVLIEFTEALADFEDDPLNEQEDIENVNPDNMIDPGAWLGDGEKTLAYLNRKRVPGLMSPIRHTGHKWRQHVEFDYGCPEGFDCKDVSYCFYTQTACDADNDQDLTCKFVFSNNVTDPNSAKVWSEGSARLEARLAYYQLRHGGLILQL